MVAGIGVMKAISDFLLGRRFRHARGRYCVRVVSTEEKVSRLSETAHVIFYIIGFFYETALANVSPYVRCARPKTQKRK